MAAYGGSRVQAAAGGSVTSLTTGNLNVTGSDLAIVAGVGETASVSRAFSFVWDPTGNNEAFTGNVADLDPGSYVGCEVEYLDDPTAANAPVRASWTPGNQDVVLLATFFTAAGDIVAADVATDTFNTTGSSLSSTAPNVVSGDMVVDFIVVGEQSNIFDGADQTETGADVDSGSYCRANMSYQSGADGGVMSWTCNGQGYGAAHVALRIPDSGGGPSGAGQPVSLLHRNQLRHILNR